MNLRICGVLINRDRVKIETIQTPTSVTLSIINQNTVEEQKNAYFSFLDKKLNEIEKYGDDFFFNQYKQMFEEQKELINSFNEIEISMI